MAVGADINALQKECDDEKGASCYELGVLYDNARNGAAQDYQKAAELYSKACELGNGGGCYYLGNLYAQGQGVKKDTNAAKNTSKKPAIWSPSLPATDIKSLSKDSTAAFARQI